MRCDVPDRSRRPAGSATAARAIRTAARAGGAAGKVARLGGAGLKEDADWRDGFYMDAKGIGNVGGRFTFTTFGARLAQLRRILRARFSSRDHMAGAVHHNGPTLTTSRLRWHLCCLYLHELKRELCNVYRRMEILRRRHLCQTGVGPLSTFEQSTLSLRCRRKLVRARKYGTQRLHAILPGATLVDHYLLTELFHPGLFAGAENREVPSRPCTEGTGLRAQNSNKHQPSPAIRQN